MQKIWKRPEKECQHSIVIQGYAGVKMSMDQILISGIRMTKSFDASFGVSDGRIRIQRQGRRTVGLGFRV
jgi:hypothetical protein